MSKLEKVVVISAFVYMAVYIPYLLLQWAGNAQLSPARILPLHLFGMALDLIALIVTIRDLYLRPFANSNAKLTWLLLILYSGGIGWIVYLFKYAFRSRGSDRISQTDSFERHDSANM